MLSGIGPVETRRCDASTFPWKAANLIGSLSQSFEDLPDAVEPFERIREAIKEAHSQLARQRPEAA